MTRLSYEEYLRKYHTLTYKNVGVSMLPLLKQGRDSFTVREVKQGESCKLWDVVLYKRVHTKHQYRQTDHDRSNIFRSARLGK